MQNDSGHSSQLALGFDLLIRNSYDITDLNFLSEFLL